MSAMTRTDVLKGVYFARLAGLVVSGVGLAVSAQNGASIAAIGLAALFLALLLSGRIQAHFWSELLVGLHALNQRDYESSKAHSLRFLAQLRERPWLKRLIWLGTSSYSLNAEVLALNNLGAAEMALDEVESARAHFNEAIALDPKCPLPYRNLGSLTLRTATTAEALPWLEKAVVLGLRGDASDRLMMSSQSRNAELSTTGVITDFRPSPPAKQAVTGAHTIYLLNDEKTPFEFAVATLETVFGMTGAQAIYIAQQVDQQGRAACAGFDDLEAARIKADEVETHARKNGHLLSCVVEPGQS
jgi:ATP-dependent Clp protease adapter protein ClpS